MKKHGRIPYEHRAPAQSVCVTLCNFIINVLDSLFASSAAIYGDKYVHGLTQNKRCITLPAVYCRSFSSEVVF